VSSKKRFASFLLIKVLPGQVAEMSCRYQGISGGTKTQVSIDKSEGLVPARKARGLIAGKDSFGVV